MSDASLDMYRINVELNHTLLEEELKGIVTLAQGAGGQAWEEIISLPLDKQRQSIRNALRHITNEHGASAMLAAKDNMEAHVNMWARERGSFDGLPLHINDSSPLGSKKLSKYADEIYERLQNDPSDAEAAFTRLLTNTVMNRARQVVSSTCRQAGLRFYRIPERLACPFCLMLASRGAVYYSAYNAGEGNRYHAHCRCTVRGAFLGEELHPVVEFLHENYGSGNKATWDEMAKSGELSKALHPYGYGVTKGRQKVTKAEIESLRLKGDKIELYRRQKALYSKIPDGELLKQSEIEFLEAFEAIGERVTWLYSDFRDDDNFRLPSNDFIWETHNKKQYELKTPRLYDDLGNPKSLDSVLKSVGKIITKKKNQAFRNHGFKKTRFMINLGDLPYAHELDRRLPDINTRPGEPKVQEIIIFSQGNCHQIELKDV